MFEVVCICNRVLAGIRTLDPLIKSQLLYQLSYEDNQSESKTARIFEWQKYYFFIKLTIFFPFFRKNKVILAFRKNKNR